MREYTMAYIDYTDIFSDTLEDHVKHLDVVLERIERAALTLKAVKWFSNKYLVHSVVGGTIKPEYTKEAVL